MGQAASAIRAASKDNEKEANDVLTALETMAELKFEAFDLKIRSSSDSLQIPIDKILVSDRYVTMSASMDAKKISESVKDVVGSFASGKILEGAYPL